MQAIQKDFWREVRNTRSRFLSILILVALAVAFLSGLRATAPDMKATVDEYLDGQGFMDIQVLSTLGLTQEDLDILLAQKGIAGGEAAYVIDAFASTPDTDIVAKVYSLPKAVNRLTLTQGRMPQAADECVVDPRMLELMDVSVGDSVELRTQGTFADTLTRSHFTIVGAAVSPYYISVERGTSTLGAGRVQAYIYLPEAAFDMDYYTAIYLLVQGAGETAAFSDQYNDLVDGVIDDMEPLSKARAALRRQELVDEANDKLAEAQQKLDDAKRDAEKKLADARAELRDARKKLDNGWAELADAKTTLATETADGEQKIADGKTELADSLKKLNDGEQEYADGVDAFGEGYAKLEDGKRKYEDGKKQYEDGVQEYEDGLAEYRKNAKKLDEAGADLSRGEDALIAGRQQLEAAQAQFDEQVTPYRLAVNQQLGTSFDTNAAFIAALTDPTVAEAVDAAYQVGVLGPIQDSLKQTEAGIADLQAGIAQADEGIAKLEALIQQLESGGGQGGDPSGGGETGGESETGGGETGGETGGTGEGAQETPSQEKPDPVSDEGAETTSEGTPAEMNALALFQETQDTPAGESGDPSGQEPPAQPTLEELKAQLEAAKAKRAEMEQQLAVVTAQQAQLQAKWAQVGAGTVTGSQFLLAANQQLQAGWDQYNQGAAEFNAGYNQYLDGRRQLAEGKQKLDDAKRELDDSAKKLDDAQQELVDGQQELDDNRQKLIDARADLDDGWQKYRDGQQELADAEQELADGIAEGQKKIADATHDLRTGEADYNEGQQEYRNGQREAAEKIADGEKELADARRKVADIATCEWYLLSRDSNPGYLGYGQDADRMGNLASVFPLLFFLVAALVCLTTMTRMVEEQRVQIGCLKALGYNRWAISRKYLGYGLLPALLGGGIGLAVGYTLFPKMIFTAYQIMYAVPDIQLRGYPDITLFSMAAAVACTTLSTLWACFATLTATPADLMRPQAPKPGKRVLLEYVRPLWRRLSFNMKVTCRNLLRYHKRFWMTVIGIGGCTALIIAGFGIRSSLLAGLDRQYSQIYNYTAQVVLASNVLEEERTHIEAYLNDEPDITAVLDSYMASATAQSPAYSTTAYLQVTEAEKLGRFITLRDFKTKAPLALDDQGAIIDQKLAELLHVRAGDTLTLDLDGRREVRIAAVTENYLGHYVYMTPAYYAQVFGENCDYNAYLLCFTEDTEALCDQIFSQLMAENGVSSVTRISDTRDTYLQSMESIDFVVVIVILSAAALAMVVLYNLSNINITERKRELATIKVLGFFDNEVSAYVYRENIILTVLGIGAGILFGHYLHVWLVKTVEIDLMMFGRETDPWAYVWAAGLTTAFSVAVNLLAHLKMRTIDMVESLKSAE